MQSAANAEMESIPKGSVRIGNVRYQKLFNLPQARTLRLPRLERKGAKKRWRFHVANLTLLTEIAHCHS